jgi:ABC-type transport system involved in multi-copper enzyme maturation permease subunit
VSRLLAVAGLAIRELWVTFRLLLLVAGLLVTALPSVLLTPQGVASDHISGRLQPFAIGLGAALALLAAVAAGSMASERSEGTAGWLVSRAVPRPMVVIGWFLAFALVLLVGLAPSAALVWLTLGPVDEALVQPLGYALAILAAWAAGLAVVALGLLLGSLLGTVSSGLVALLVAGALLVPPTLGVLPTLAYAPAPAAALALVAELPSASRPIADALRTCGLSLAAAGGVLVLAAAAMQRADL